MKKEQNEDVALQKGKYEHEENNKQTTSQLDIVNCLHTRILSVFLYMLLIGLKFPVQRQGALCIYSIHQSGLFKKAPRIYCQFLVYTGISEI